MNRKITMCIEVTKEEANVISELLEMLEKCPIPLSDAGYADVLRTIARGENDTCIDDDFYKICIEYERDEQ